MSPPYSSKFNSPALSSVIFRTSFSTLAFSGKRLQKRLPAVSASDCGAEGGNEAGPVAAGMTKVRGVSQWNLVMRSARPHPFAMKPRKNGAQVEAALDFGYFLYFVAFAGSKKEIGFQAVLAIVEFAVASVECVEFRVGAALHDAAFFHNEDLVGVADR